MSAFRENEPNGRRHSVTATLEMRSEPNKFKTTADIAIYMLMVFPAIMAFIFIKFGILYTGGLRILVFDLAWVIFSFALIGASIISNAPVIDEVRNLSRTYMAVFALFACVWIYTTAVIAPNIIMANYASGMGVAAILAGLAAAALKRRFGNRIIMGISWALFVSMLIHAPHWLWLYILEGQNSNFVWKSQLPGFPAVRMYNFSVEAGIAAGLGLFYLSNSENRLKRILLAVGTTLLWMLLFWSGGRGGFLALLVSIIFVTLITPLFLRKMWKVLGSSITIGACLSLLLPVPSGDYGLLGRLDRTVNSGSLDEISSGRLTLWSDAYSIFLEKPIFGHGISQYNFVTTQTELTKYVQVHNIVLESLISFGVVGTAALVFLLGKIWLTAAIRLRGGRSLSTLPVFLIATSLLVHGLVSGTYYHIHSVLIIAISLGLLLNDHSESTIDLNDP